MSLLKLHRTARRTPSSKTLDELAALGETLVEPKISDLTIDASIDALGMREKFIANYHPPLSSDTARNYLAVDSAGRAHHLALLDADQQIMGLLSTMWNRTVLTTTTRRSDRTIEASAEHLALMELSAVQSEVCPDRSLRDFRPRICPCWQHSSSMEPRHSISLIRGTCQIPSSTAYGGYSRKLTAVASHMGISQRNPGSP